MNIQSRNGMADNRYSSDPVSGFSSTMMTATSSGGCTALINKLIICCMSALLLFSCTTSKQLRYLQDIDADGPENFFPLERPEYRIQKQDVLYIRFITMNDDVNKILNMTSTSLGGQSMMSESAIFLSGYAVNDEGEIFIPLVGKVHVLEKTLDEAIAAIETQSAEYLKEATLIVKLLSFKFTVLGEVRSPGAYRNFNNQLTVLEAIAMAGDITDTGDKERILVLRSTKEGTKSFRINVKKKDLLSSEGYFLLPNDIVIVEPLDTKIFRMNWPTVSFAFSTVFSTISLTLLMINFFNK